MNTFTSNIAKSITKNTAKLFITKAVTAAFVLVVSSFAHANSTLETVTDNYLYESLIQTEFDIENKMQVSVAQSSTETVQEALMVANTVTNEQLLASLSESAQVPNVLLTKERAE